VAALYGVLLAADLCELLGHGHQAEDRERPS
jgi:hypothetical protein